MTLETIATIADYLGKILIVWAVLLVHLKLRKEDRVDKAVEREIKTEEVITVLGILFLTAAFVIKLII